MHKPEAAHGVASSDEGADDAVVRPPAAEPACLYGLLGDIAKAACRDTEANPFAVGLNGLSFLGAAVGRGPFMPVGDTVHHPRIFSLHVGRSGIGRKGDSISLIRRITTDLTAIDPNLAPGIHTGGLSTREGLAALIHDGFHDGRADVPAIEDKRLWVVESEFANVLHQSRRDGNTLSSALRDCWDGASLQPATKANRVWATDPHVGIAAAITPHELKSLTSGRELANGFANRFVIIYAERCTLIALPTATDAAVVRDFACRIGQVLKFASADERDKNNTLEMRLSVAGKAHYEEMYHGELNRYGFGPRIDGLLERRAPVLLRIAMLLALTDHTHVVEPRHLDAALAWVRYWSDSVRFIFADDQQSERVERQHDLDNRIVEYLSVHGRRSRTSISRECLRGKVSKTELDASLSRLLGAAPPKIIMTREERIQGVGSGTIFYALADSANSANRESDQRLDAAVGAGEVSEESEARQGKEFHPTSRIQDATPEFAESA